MEKLKLNRTNLILKLKGEWIPELNFAFRFASGKPNSPKKRGNRGEIETLAKREESVFDSSRFYVSSNIGRLSKSSPLSSDPFTSTSSFQPLSAHGHVSTDGGDFSLEHQHWPAAVSPSWTQTRYEHASVGLRVSSFRLVRDSYPSLFSRIAHDRNHLRSSSRYLHRSNIKLNRSLHRTWNYFDCYYYITSIKKKKTIKRKKVYHKRTTLLLSSYPNNNISEILSQTNRHL